MSSSKIPTLNLTISAWILLILFIIIYFIKELLKLAASPSWYFQQWESYHDLAIIITTVIIIWLNPLDEVQSSLYTWDFGRSVALLLSSRFLYPEQLCLIKHELAINVFVFENC